MLSSPGRRGRAAALAAAALLGGLPLAARAASADHRAFPALQRRFKDGREVTAACLSCHTEAAAQLERTSHWQWEGEPVRVPGHAGLHRLGKLDVVNNFCIGIQSNEESCSKCHISYGFKPGGLPGLRHDDVDCLACHDGTGDYAKKAAGEGGGAGDPVDWTRLAQGVGPTSARTCGACHFNGGGGEGVKHGDLDASLLEADKRLDVHMAKDGLGFTCSTCHRGEEVAHALKGRMPSVSVDAADSVTCGQCHGASPHGADFVFRSERERSGASRFASGPERSSPWQSLRRNWHARRIACQTCHIPAFARAEATRVWWDWSKAGRHHDDGRPVVEFDDDGNMSYWGIKGAFRWAKDVVPTYRWWDGTSGRYLLGDKFDASQVLVLNPPQGSPQDAAARIWPFKVFQGNQPYDPVNRILIQPHLSGKKGSGAYWADYDWQRAAAIGMKAAGLPFSGQVAFTRTDMYWPITHMVAQGSQGVGCADCHSRKSRLAGVGGVYIVGFDRSPLLDLVGWLSAALSALAAAGHGLLRWLGRRGKLDGLAAWLKRRRP